MTKKPFIPPELLSPSAEFAHSSTRIGLFWWYWDHVEKQIHMSPELIRILGYTLEEFSSSQGDFYKNIHPEDVQANLEKVRRLIYGKDRLYEMEFRVKDDEGKWQWYYNRGVAISKDEDGKATVIGGISLDISGKFKKLMAKLDEQEKFEYIFRNSDDAMVAFVARQDGSIIVEDVNKAGMALFNRGAEVVGNPIPDENINDPVIGEGGEFFREVLEKGSARREHRFLMPDGERKWLDFTGHSFTRSGKTQVLGIVKDLTSGKKTEAALKESQFLYKTLFEAAEDPIGLFSLDREIVLINRAFHETFGYSYDEFRELGWMELIHPEDRASLAEKESEFLAGGFIEADYRAKHKSGELIHVSSKNVLIPGQSGEKSMILSIARDMTRSLRAMEELEEARRRAEESDKLKSAFLANMSHEIRTPMNSIVGFSNLLVNPDLDEAARTLYVNRITRNSEVLLALISDIVDLAKIESGQLPLVFGKQKLHTILKEMKQYGRDEIKRLDKKHLSFKTELLCDGEIESDLIRINQILKNLVNNAIKFTDRGEVEVGCRVGRSPQYVILYVKDSGIGIDPSNFEVIFDQFRQIDGSNTRKYGGTGLGLAICKNLTWMMGGEIWVESTVGEGSTFLVELPLKATRRSGKDQVLGVYGEEEQESVAAKRVMVVDDEQDSLELFKEMLGKLGHEVLTANNGFEALQLLEKHEAPDLIFMDDQMPVLSGTETMRIIRERHPGLRVVVQSAHALVGDRNRFLKEGFDAYLPKPFTPDQLEEILDH